MARLRSFVVSTGVLVPLVTVFLLLALAAPAPAAQPVPLAVSPGSESVPPPDGLTAIDVAEDALPALQRLAVRYQDQPRDGLIRAAATAAQLAQLRQDGIAFSEIGEVAVVTQGDRRLSEIYCNGINTGDYTIPWWYSYQYVYDPIGTYCYGAGTVGWIDVHYFLQNVYLGPGGTPSEVDVGVGRTQPSWLYVMLELWDNYCAPSGPLLGLPGAYEHWVFNVDATMGTNVFRGVPVNQQWDLFATDHCNGYPDGWIDYWEIYIYYIEPTPTVTPTPSKTSTPTSTTVPSKTFTGSVLSGFPGNPEALGVAGAEVMLRCSQVATDPGSPLASMLTDAMGHFSLTTPANCPYYSIVETNLPGWTSTGATSVGGTVITADWIQYSTLYRRSLADNNFWDRPPAPPTATPTRPSGGAITPTPTRTATATRTRTPGGPTATRTRTPTVTSTRWPARVRIYLPIILSNYPPERPTAAPTLGARAWTTIMSENSEGSFPDGWTLSAGSGAGGE